MRKIKKKKVKEIVMIKTNNSRLSNWNKRNKHIVRVFVWPLMLVLMACGVTFNFKPQESNKTTVDLPLPAVTKASEVFPQTYAATPMPLNINQLPLYWFAPLPVEKIPGGTEGSDDFLDLFEPNSPWMDTSNYLQVFKLYGGWAIRGSKIEELRQSIQAIRQRGLALAVEVGPLNPTQDCGFQIEGYAGDEGIETLKRIKRAGGDLNFIAFDEPYFYGHFYDGPQACHWSEEKIAKDIDTFIQQARVIFPDVIIGDIEPVTGPADSAAYQNWLVEFKQVNGYDLAFLHLDVGWGENGWPEKIKSIEEFGRERNIPIGIIYTGNFQDPNTEAWLAIAGERVKRYELETNGQPDHVIFQSWNDKPDRVLPESDPATFTGFIKRYFEDKQALGFSANFNGNLALKKTVRVSRNMAGSDGSLAIDGDRGTSWNSGFEAPQWIEIDLEGEYDIKEIHLVIDQYPPGLAHHRLKVRGKGTNGDLIEVQDFKGEMTSGQVLSFVPQEILKGIQFVRIESVSNPSWIAWSEIEVIQAGNTP